MNHVSVLIRSLLRAIDNLSIWAECLDAIADFDRLNIPVLQVLTARRMACKDSVQLHPCPGEMIRILRDAGFEALDLIELFARPAPPGIPTTCT